MLESAIQSRDPLRYSAIQSRDPLRYSAIQSRDPLRYSAIHGNRMGQARVTEDDVDFIERQQTKSIQFYID